MSKRNKVIKGQYRHGDVLLHPVSGVPEGAKQIAADRIVLAEGEVTGHAHRLTGTAVLLEHEGKRYLVVNGEAASLDHEEHGHIAVAPGTYEVRQQQEWDLSKQWRKVRD